MKFHETHYEEYVNNVKKTNIHPEIVNLKENLPNNYSDFKNLILYGPSGGGKYSQALHLLEKYSTSMLKYEKKMLFQGDKGEFSYKISDIHYEIDMSLLGCNSKIIWNEVFSQIIDIVSMKKEKFGIILCKNFHEINFELLEIFYSYMQQYNQLNTPVKIAFILLTENIGFLPNNIINCSHIISVKKPSKEQYQSIGYKSNEDINILKLKEIKMLNNIQNEDEIPTDLFDIIYYSLKRNISTPIKLGKLRELLYDILIYGINVHEIIFSLLSDLIKEDKLTKNSLKKITKNLPGYLKHFNNNYRPIYHLENIFLSIINEL